jgi:hypothetical protein
MVKINSFTNNSVMFFETKVARKNVKKKHIFILLIGNTFSTQNMTIVGSVAGLVQRTVEKVKHCLRRADVKVE